jgi:hypothetical protein
VSRNTATGSLRAGSQLHVYVAPQRSFRPRRAARETRDGGLRERLTPTRAIVRRVLLQRLVKPILLMVVHVITQEPS